MEGGGGAPVGDIFSSVSDLANLTCPESLLRLPHLNQNKMMDLSCNFSSNKLAKLRRSVSRVHFENAVFNNSKMQQSDFPLKFVPEYSLENTVRKNTAWKIQLGKIQFRKYS